jgi:hypothetical protein
MVQDGFEQAPAPGLGGCELRFQLVAERHQFIDLGDDAVLFGEDRKVNSRMRTYRAKGERRRTVCKP